MNSGPDQRPLSAFSTEHLREYLCWWREKHGIRNDEYVPLFFGEITKPRSLAAEVGAALDQYIRDSSANASETRRHAESLWKLADAVLAGRSGAGLLRARWKALPMATRDALGGVARMRSEYWKRSGLNVTADTLDTFIEHSAPREIAEAVRACCAFGARMHWKQPSRGTGRRHRLPLPSPTLAVPVPSLGRQPNPFKDELVQRLGMIFYDIAGQEPKGSRTFADLVRDVFTVAAISGADERIRDYFHALESRQRRSHRR